MPGFGWRKLSLIVRRNVLVEGNVLSLMERWNASQSSSASLSRKAFQKQQYNSRQVYWTIQATLGRADEFLLCHCINMCHTVINNMGLKFTTLTIHFIIPMSYRRFPQPQWVFWIPLNLAALCKFRVGSGSNSGGIKMSSLSARKAVHVPGH